MKERLTRVVLNLTPGELVWLAVGVLLLGYEVFAIISPEADVLTRAWRAHSLRWIVIPFGAGFLVGGHLCGPSLPYFAKWTPVIGFSLVGAALAWGAIVHDPLPDWARFPLFLAGVAAGILTWSGRP
jgi:hypothetical protein